MQDFNSAAEWYVFPLISRFSPAGRPYPHVSCLTAVFCRILTCSYEQLTREYPEYDCYKLYYAQVQLLIRRRCCSE